MWDFLTNEAGVRLVSFFGVLAALTMWEILAPRRPLSARKSWRWASNLGLVVLNTVFVRLVFPLGVVGIALFAESRGWGLFQYVDVPYWVAVTGSVVLLDLVIYLQHVMFHAVPALWRLHMVHHADLDIDVTTGLRFHTIEILISLGIKISAVLLIGAPAAAVVIFEVILNATSMFNHSNVQLTGWLDRILRLIVVTPEMHRVHHSIVSRETNSNFGFNLPWWDFLLGTYRAQPAAGHLGMTIGVAHLRNERQVDRLDGMLLLPVHSVGAYPINKQEFARAANETRMPGRRPRADRSRAIPKQAPRPCDKAGALEFREAR